MSPVVRSIRRIDVVDPDDGSTLEGRRVRIEDGVIVDVDADPGTPIASDEIDAAGLTAIPGLIDCHIHALAVTKDLRALLGGSLSYLGIAAGRVLEGMLRRGFTTVRDCGGADRGIAAAVRDGHVRGPEAVYCGRAISQTGGQGDPRSHGEPFVDPDPRAPNISRLADGADAVRTAVRDEARQGAGFVKLLAETEHGASGRAELSDAEVRAAVDEAAAWGIPVTAHAYTPERVRRLVAAGISCIEHGNRLDDDTARRLAEHGVDFVPTLGAFRSYAEAEGDRGIDRAVQEWAAGMVADGLRALEAADRAGVRIGFGTDLTVAHERQNEEFAVRAEIQSPEALLRSATSDAARILRRDDRGRIAPGLVADILLVRRHPFEDVGVLADVERGHAGIVRGGRLVVDRRDRGRDR